MRRADHFDQQTLIRMSAARRDEPVVIAMLLGKAWVIDGNHRLEKRRLDGLSEPQVIEVPFDLLKPHELESNLSRWAHRSHHRFLIAPATIEDTAEYVRFRLAAPARTVRFSPTTRSPPCISSRRARSVK